MTGIKEADYLAEADVGLFSINFTVGKRRQIDCGLRAVPGRLLRSLNRFDLHQPDWGFVILSHSPSLSLLAPMIIFRSLSFARDYSRNIPKAAFTMRRRNGQVNRTDPNIHAQEAPNQRPAVRTSLPRYRIAASHQRNIAQKFFAEAAKNLLQWAYY